MKIQLICNSENRDRLTKELELKGFEIFDKADYAFVEKKHTDKQYIFAKDAHKNISLLKYDNIIYFESFNKTIEVITENGKYEIKEKLYILEQQLYNRDFVRVNKSMIVNLLKVNKIIPWIGSKFVLDMKNGTRIEVTRTYFPDFKKRLGL